MKVGASAPQMTSADDRAMPFQMCSELDEVLTDMRKVDAAFVTCPATGPFSHPQVGRTATSRPPSNTDWAMTRGPSTRSCNRNGSPSQNKSERSRTCRIPRVAVPMGGLAKAGNLSTLPDQIAPNCYRLWLGESY